MQNVKASIVPTQIKGPVLYIMLLLYTCLGKDLYQIVKLPDVSVFDSSLTAPSLQLTVEDQIFFSSLFISDDIGFSVILR